MTREERIAIYEETMKIVNDGYYIKDGKKISICINEDDKTGRLYKLTEALDLAEIDIEGHFHDGLNDALNTAHLISKLEVHKNYRTLIERIRENEAQQAPLTISLGNILQGLVLETA